MVILEKFFWFVYYGDCIGIIGVQCLGKMYCVQVGFVIDDWGNWFRNRCDGKVIYVVVIGYCICSGEIVSGCVNRNSKKIVFQGVIFLL